MLEVGLERCLVGYVKGAALSYHEQKPLGIHWHSRSIENTVCTVTFAHKVTGPKSEGMEIQVQKRNWKKC